MKNEIIKLISSYDNVCLSGGANGADRLFGLWASENNHNQIHFSFDRHKVLVPEDVVLRLPSGLLLDSNIKIALNIANKSLQRSVPKTGTYVYNLLARNNYQLLNTNSVYAMANLVSPTQVSGGTAWAVQMYIDSVNNPNIYVLSLLDKIIYKYNSTSKIFEETNFVPTPSGIWTGIGSRDAIEEDLRYFEQFFR